MSNTNSSSKFLKCLHLDSKTFLFRVFFSCLYISQISQSDIVLPRKESFGVSNFFQHQYIGKDGSSILIWCEFVFFSITSFGHVLPKRFCLQVYFLNNIRCSLIGLDGYWMERSEASIYLIFGSNNRRNHWTIRSIL